MSEHRPHDPALDAARYRSHRADASDAGEQGPDIARLTDKRLAGEADEPLAARRRRDRIDTQHLWVERQIVEAQRRGDFDDLPLAGKPIPGLSSGDPDWWTKALVERERLDGVAPESVLLRREDADLDARLDALADEAAVRESIEAFNARVLSARARPSAGPPLVTGLRDATREVAAWRARRGR
ncbi:DUF1992 domain-containing protein [Demequina soli]|uniref:DnaJ family domain-containing protein n=1 Tax=Demequina soli TaxID=1638987 RepID=UPI000781B79F|nr:DUF1992 domain-containing protein [Demequina soli]